MNAAAPALQGQIRLPRRRCRRVSEPDVSAVRHLNHQNDTPFAQMVGRCQERIFRLALRITRNHADAEDAQQETLLKAHRNLARFQGRSQFTTWISRIAINESLMSLRKRRGGRMSLEEANPLWETTTAKEHWHSAIIEGPETAYSRQET